MKPRAGAEVVAVVGLQTAGLLLGAAISGLLILFIAAEILTDPGGLIGFLMVLAWLALPAGFEVSSPQMPNRRRPSLPT